MKARPGPANRPQHDHVCPPHHHLQHRVSSHTSSKLLLPQLLAQPRLKAVLSSTDPADLSADTHSKRGCREHLGFHLRQVPSPSGSLFSLGSEVSQKNLPDSATSEIGTPCSRAMKPSTEKMAKPATKLVALFREQSMMQSLQEGDQREMGISCCRMDPLRIMSVLSFPSWTALLRNSNVVPEPCRSKKLTAEPGVQELQKYTWQSRVMEHNYTAHSNKKNYKSPENKKKKHQKIRKPEN